MGHGNELREASGRVVVRTETRPDSIGISPPELWRLNAAPQLIVAPSRPSNFLQPGPDAHANFAPHCTLSTSPGLNSTPRPATAPSLHAPCHPTVAPFAGDRTISGGHCRRRGNGLPPSEAVLTLKCGLRADARSGCLGGGLPWEASPRGGGLRLTLSAPCIIGQRPALLQEHVRYIPAPNFPIGGEVGVQ